MRELLDKMFENKKASLIIPVAIATLSYLLFVFFGTAADKINLMIKTPIASVICFVAVFIVVYAQVKNPACPEWFLNLFELVAAILFVVYAVAGGVLFVVSGFQDFNIGICVGFVAYSAISWAHNKRVN